MKKKYFFKLYKLLNFIINCIIFLIFLTSKSKVDEIVRNIIIKTLFLYIASFFYVYSAETNDQQDKENQDRPAVVLTSEVYINEGIGYERKNPPDFQNAIGNYKKALTFPGATKYLSNAYYYLGVRLIKTGDYQDGLKNFELAAEISHPIAQYNLGCVYWYGQYGIQKNINLAASWFKKASSSGDPANVELWNRGLLEGLPEAQVNLAIICEHGEIQGSGETEARILYEQAAAKENPIALNNLGIYYFFGIGGIPEDLTKAKDCFRRAKLRGHTEASVNLGIIEEYEQNNGIAFELYKQGWEVGGYPLAAYYAGVIKEKQHRDGEAEDQYERAAKIPTFKHECIPLYIAAKKNNERAVIKILAKTRSMTDYRKDDVFVLLADAWGLAKKANSQRVIQYLEGEMYNWHVNHSITQRQIHDDQIQQDIKYLREKPALYIFYKEMKDHFGCKLAAYKFLNTGILARAQNQIDAFINLLNTVTGALPIVGVAVGYVVGEAIGNIVDQHVSLQACRASSVNDDVFKIGNLSDLVARNAAFVYERQLLNFTQDSVQDAAQKGVERMINFIIDGSFSQIKDWNGSNHIVEKLIYALASFSEEPQPHLFSLSGINAIKDRKLIQRYRVRDDEDHYGVIDIDRYDLNFDERLSKQLNFKKKKDCCNIL